MSPQEKILHYWRREFGENMGMALSTVWENKVRSLLTMLGIFVAIVTVVLVMAHRSGVAENVK